MDPITAAALAALAGSLGSEAGRQTWQGLAALVRRPFVRLAQTPGMPEISSGELELAALEGNPTDPIRAQALATALVLRTTLDDEFRALLEEWSQQLGTASGGEVHNRISGGTQNGPVLQGRDFSGISFNVTAPAPAAPDRNSRAEI